MEAEQLAQRELVQRMMAHCGLDATNLAKKAKLSPSTLTRFLGPKPVDHLLSSRTLAKLYVASGLPPEVPSGGYVVNQPDQIALLMLWDNLSSAERRLVLAYIKNLKGNH